MLICCQGNVGPAAFWLLAYLLRTPEALKAVRTELTRVCHAHDMELTQPTPIFGKTRPGTEFFEVTDLMFRCSIFDFSRAAVSNR